MVAYNNLTNEVNITILKEGEYYYPYLYFGNYSNNSTNNGSNSTYKGQNCTDNQENFKKMKRLPEIIDKILQNLDHSFDILDKVFELMGVNGQESEQSNPDSGII